MSWCSSSVESCRTQHFGQINKSRHSTNLCLGAIRTLVPSPLFMPSVAPMPQAGCCHHKKPLALNEHRHHNPHLAEMKSGTLPPATDQTTGVANAKVDAGSTQPTATSASTLDRPPCRPHVHVAAEQQDPRDVAPASVSALTTFSSSHDLPSRAAAPPQLGAPAARGEEALSNAHRVME
jgi:hypothetical protein